jgi:hypothetical protein
MKHQLYGGAKIFSGCKTSEVNERGDDCEEAAVSLSEKYRDGFLIIPGVYGASDIYCSPGYSALFSRWTVDLMLLFFEKKS